MRHPLEGVVVLDAREALLSAEDQCEAHLAKDPAWPGCASGLARLFAGMGDLRRARKWGAQWLALQSHADAADIRMFQQLLNAP
jgi:hypothetical protein